MTKTLNQRVKELEKNKNKIVLTDTSNPNLRAELTFSNGILKWVVIETHEQVTELELNNITLNE